MHLKGILSILISLIIFCTINLTIAGTFRQAKKQASILYQNHRITFYCGCKFSKNKRIDLQSCGVTARKNKKRMQRIEWEHIVPAYAFGHTRSCWREPLCKRKNGKRYTGRACCEKIDSVFREMYTDLRNLVPALGEINGDRSHFSFMHIGVEPHQYGNCKMIVHFQNKKAEPPPETRGFIARTYFYMHKEYGLPISNKQMKLFHAWNKKYPQTAWEKEREIKIRKLKS